MLLRSKKKKHSCHPQLCRTIFDVGPICIAFTHTDYKKYVPKIIFNLCYESVFLKNNEIIFNITLDEKNHAQKKLDFIIAKIDHKSKKH